MRRPERPLRLFAAAVAVVASLLASSSAFAAPSANGRVVSDANTGTAVAKGARAGDKGQDPDELRERLAEVVDAYKKSEDRLGLLQKRTTKVTKEVAATKSRLSRVRARLAEIARMTYINGGVDNTVLALLQEGGPVEVAQRMTTMAVLSSADDVTLKDAARERRQLRRQLADLNTVKKRAVTEKARLKAKRAKLNAALREAARRAEEQATRSRVSGQFACPVGSPYTMMNTFGAPRGGGRSHEGTDIAAPKSTPIYAVEGGTIDRAYSNTLGGIALILAGDSGDSYYYAHQEVNTVRTGQRVEAGQLVARVGMTGDAQGTIYHLHFERWPNGGTAVDPWPFLYPLCGEKG
ncbi:MAG: peptidoglycan DD-metalloendopeptidase family protein [Streptosporangiales bacterium]|nr:peptidoglycan DD-metalloendopeptidase family protein [Streptosporangiales bacterium]